MFTTKEAQKIECLVKGMVFKEAAHACGLTLPSYRMAIRTLRLKYGAATTCQLVALYVRQVTL